MSTRRRIGALALVVGLGACADQIPSRAGFLVPGTGLIVPRVEGWVRDESVRLEDPRLGGVALRLLRENGVPGAPRVDVNLQPQRAYPVLLEQLITENLRDMARLEANREIRIDDVQQREVHVGPRRAQRIRHEYSVGEGGNQVAITQVSLLLVLNGRGVVITAYGRNELYHPVAESIDRIFEGIEIEMRAAEGPLPNPTVLRNPDAAPAEKSNLQELRPGGD